MKKVSSIALALLFAASAFAADEIIGQLNPYAYSVQGQAKNGKIAVQYSLNSPADSTIIAIYHDGEEVGTQVVADNTPGLHSAVVDLAPFTEAGTYTVGIRVYGTSPEEPSQLRVIKEGTTDTTGVSYSFYHPKGVAVDCNPFSENFGRVLTAEAMYDTPDAGYHSSAEKQGVYAFDPTFNTIPNGSGRAFKGGLTYHFMMSTDETKQSYAPYRIRISKEGRTFISMLDDQLDLIYEASSDLQTFTPIVVGAQIGGLPAMNASLDLKDNEDGSISLLALNCNMRGIGYNNNGWELVEYTIPESGDITSRVIMDSVALNAVIKSDPWNTTLTYSNTQFQYAADGGYWFINSRSNAYEASLAHIKADGTWDMVMSRIDGTTTGNAEFYGGAGLIEIDGKIYVGMNRYSSSIGQIGIFSVDYTGASTTVTYEKSLRALAIGRNLNDFALDFGHNLYSCGNSNEKLIAFAMPYSGMVETPVEAEVIRTSLDNINGEMKATKMIENGKVVIIKNGVKYDMLGTVIE